MSYTPNPPPSQHTPSSTPPIPRHKSARSATHSATPPDPPHIQTLRHTLSTVSTASTSPSHYSEQTAATQSRQRTANTQSSLCNSIPTRRMVSIACTLYASPCPVLDRHHRGPGTDPAEEKRERKRKGGCGRKRVVGREGGGREKGENERALTAFSKKSKVAVPSSGTISALAMLRMKEIRISTATRPCKQLTRAI